MDSIVAFVVGFVAGVVVAKFVRVLPLIILIAIVLTLLWYAGVVSTSTISEILSWVKDTLISVISVVLGFLSALLTKTAIHTIYYTNKRKFVKRK